MDDLLRVPRVTAAVAAFGLVLGLCVVAGPASAQVTSAGGSAVQKICHEPAPSSVLSTGSHRTPAGAPAAAIRVDQVGYPTSALKQAEIMTKSKPASALHWVVVRAGSCTVAASGLARPDLGAWSKRYGWVWGAGFSAVHTPGSYRVGILNDPSAASPWFRVGPAAQLYARPLANALSFYQNERDGPDFIHSALRSAPGHLNDASAMTYRTPPVDGNGNFKGSLAKYATGVRINATGGWWDAGDYLHFVETTSYTEAILLQGIASFPGQMGAGASADFTGEARFGMDFLQRMWHQKTKTLYYEVGTGEANSYYFADHDIWRLPQADDHYMGSNPHYIYIRHPPVFRAARPGSLLSPNLAGRLTADFALCYQLFRKTDPGYADGCLREARTVYSLANTHWKGQLMTAIPFDFYPETSWKDDMMLGATELAIALRDAGRPDTGYLRDAAAWASAWIHGKQALTDTLNLYDVSALADYELDLALRGQHVSGLAVTRAQLLANLRGQIQKGIHVAASDPFRFGFAWDQYDTTTHGAGLTVMAKEYDALTGRPVYAGWAQHWLDNILGSNGWGVSLVVGDGTVFPDCMQHQVTNLVGSHDGKPPVLAGAAVEGPNSFAATGTVPNMRRCNANAPGDVPYAAYNGHKAVFQDNVQSYSTVEPAIDLTALTPLAFAWMDQASR
ncbi:MAG TPA: glycoside hydrolase family 9 protein [Streptosporangiaceae bacterium]